MHLDHLPVKRPLLGRSGTQFRRLLEQPAQRVAPSPATHGLHHTEGVGHSAHAQTQDAALGAFGRPQVRHHPVGEPGACVHQEPRDPDIEEDHVDPERQDGGREERTANDGREQSGQRLDDPGVDREFGRVAANEQEARRQLLGAAELLGLANQHGRQVDRRLTLRVDLLGLGLYWQRLGEHVKITEHALVSQKVHRDDDGHACDDGADR